MPIPLSLSKRGHRRYARRALSKCSKRCTLDRPRAHRRKGQHGRTLRKASGHNRSPAASDIQDHGGISDNLRAHAGAAAFNG